MRAPVPTRSPGNGLERRRTSPAAGAEREKRPAPSRASCMRRVCGGLVSREGLHLRRRLMPGGPVPDGWAACLCSAAIDAIPVGADTWFSAASAWHGTWQAGAGLVDDKSKDIPPDASAPAVRTVDRTPAPSRPTATSSGERFERSWRITYMVVFVKLNRLLRFSRRLSPFRHPDDGQDPDAQR